LAWPENYGEEREGDHKTSTLYHQFKEGWKTTISDSNVWRIGMTQALSEGGMYTVRFDRSIALITKVRFVHCYIYFPNVSNNEYLLFRNWFSLCSCGFQLC
jgi:hypothetical protein